MPRPTSESGVTLRLEQRIDELEGELRILRADARRHSQERELLRQRVIWAAAGNICAKCGARALEREAPRGAVVLPQM